MHDSSSTISSTSLRRTGDRARDDQDQLGAHGIPHQQAVKHFKHFDHRIINPMADILENPLEQQATARYPYVTH